MSRCPLPNRTLDSVKTKPWIPGASNRSNDLSPSVSSDEDTEEAVTTCHYAATPASSCRCESRFTVPKRGRRKRGSAIQMGIALTLLPRWAHGAIIKRHDGATNWIRWLRTSRAKFQEWGGVTAAWITRERVSEQNCSTNLDQVVSNGAM